MSEQTRMSKYKDLRNNIDDDTSYVPREEDDSDDDFLSFIPKSNHHESLEPKTYETLKYESNPFESLHEERDVTRTRSDTRLDILNAMKEDASSQDTICDYHTSELRRGHAQKRAPLPEKQEDSKLTKILNGVVGLLVVAVIVFIVMTFLNI